MATLLLLVCDHKLKGDDKVSPKMGQKLTDNPKDKRIEIRMDKETVRKMDCLVSEQNSDRSKIIRQGIQNEYFKIKRDGELKMIEEKFIEQNLKNKIPFLMDEHNYLIKVLYDDACDNLAIQDGEFNIRVGQFMSYTKIKEKAKEIMTDTVLLICLKELECMDFLINAMTNPYKEAGYAIRPLGLEYVKRYIL